MFYVPLTGKGKFYEVAVVNGATAAAANNNTNNISNNLGTNQSNNKAHHSTGGGGGVNGNTNNTTTMDMGRKTDYVYRISDLVLNQSTLPLNLKSIYVPSFVDMPGKAKSPILSL